jgi:murein L,D-transpeptidase YcbB/YkuD
MRKFGTCAVSLPTLLLSCILSAGPLQAEPKDLPRPSLAERTEFRIWLRDESVVTLRRMLAIAGIPSVPDTVAERYDLQLVEAVRQFQRRERLANTGLPRKATISRLNDIARFAAAGLTQDGERATASTAPKKAEPAPVAKIDPATASSRKTDQSPAVPSTPAPTAAPAASEKTAPAKTAIKGAAKPSVACERHIHDKTAPAELPMVDKNSIDRQREAIARYETIAAAGGFPVVHQPPKLGYCLGQDHPAVASVIDRLVADNYLPATYRGTTAYSQAIVDAVKQFQDAHGLAPSGRVGSDTRAAMNVPIAERLAAMRTSLQRLEKIFARGEWSPDQLRVLVNLPSASVQVLGGNELVAGYRAIVGRDERQSPEFVATIPDIQLVPPWHAPASIVARDIAPRVRKDPRYLQKHNMRALRNGQPVDPARVNWRTGPFPQVEQRPGPHNALGLIRFGTTARGAYYLHGTSDPTLLARSRGKRFLSSGCVRLADPALLAALILGGTQDTDGTSWTLEKLRARIAAHGGGWEPGQRIRLAKAVPLIWTYLTGWASRDGRVHFRPDSYEREEEIATAR